MAFWLGGCAMRQDVDAVAARMNTMEKAMEEQRAAAAALRADLDATRTRLETALRANADANTDALSDRSKLQALGGRMDEAAHSIDELKKEVASTRRELDARLDDVRRAQGDGSKSPPVAIPADKVAHFAAVEQAHGRQDWNLTRTLGREYLGRYPEDERADDVIYLMGNASLKEGRAASALGEYNRLLKQFPKSNVLGPTLFDMGEAYLLQKDCQNAKLAFSSCEKRFAGETVGKEARGRLAKIAAPAPGMCTAP
jgi:TolA-binding protein